MEDNFQELKKAVGFYTQMKPKERTPEEEEQERKEYEDFLMKTLKQMGEKEWFSLLWFFNDWYLG